MNKIYFLSCFFILASSIGSYGQSNSVGIGTLTPNAKAILDLVSIPADAQGFLLPRVANLPTGYGSSEKGMVVYHNGIIRSWDGSVWDSYNTSATTLWQLNNGQVASPFNGAKDVNVNQGWLATNNRLYIGNGFGSSGTMGPSALFVGGSEINLGKAAGNKINFLDGFNKRIIADSNNWTFSNLENSGVTNSSFLLNNTANSRFRVGTSSNPDQLTLLTATGNLGIGISTPTQRLQVAGNITIPATNNYMYNSAKTYYKSVAPAAFIHSGSSSGNNELSVAGNVLNLSNGGSSVFGYSAAWLDLPDSALISSIMIRYYDSTNDVNEYAKAILYRTSLVDGSVTIMGEVSSVGEAATSSVRVKTSSSISNARIDNQDYTYTIGITLGNTDSIKFYGTQITYSVLKAD